MRSCEYHHREMCEMCTKKFVLMINTHAMHFDTNLRAWYTRDWRILRWLGRRPVRYWWILRRLCLRVMRSGNYHHREMCEMCFTTFVFNDEDTYNTFLILLTWELGTPEIEGFSEGWLLGFALTDGDSDGMEDGWPDTLGFSDGWDVGQSDIEGFSDGLDCWMVTRSFVCHHSEMREMCTMIM